MPLLEDIPQPKDGFYVVVTGANSGLGLGIGCRLIDEFLQTRPQSQSLVLITTTRSVQKGVATVEALREHLQKSCREIERTKPGVSQALQRRIYFRPELVDLTNLVSVQKLAKRLRETTPKLDAVICNAGIGGWVDLYWGKAVWTILTDWTHALTWPTFKKSGRGWVTKPQIPRNQHGRKKVEEPPLGEVFTANFFGHYMLCHYLSPLLARHGVEEGTKGRIIWVSSLEGYTKSVDMNDIQGIASEEPYESSKRLTDLVGLSSTLPSAEPIVNNYLGVEDSERTTKPRIYVTHPGICGTTIFALNWFLDYAMFLVFYLARWFGSQWHPITPYKGATAMVWLTLATQSQLDTMEDREGVGKWGSATDWWGSERVERTEVEGWGWGGRLGEWTKRKGRSPYAKDLTKDDREAFEQTGKTCWEEMERLRAEWEKRLIDSGEAVEMGS